MLGAAPPILVERARRVMKDLRQQDTLKKLLPVLAVGAALFLFMGRR